MAKRLQEPFVLLALLLALFGAPSCSARLSPDRTLLGDFSSFYFAAQLAFNDGETPYDHDALVRRAKAEGVPFAWPFLYPPVSFLPIGWMSVVTLESARLIVVVVDYLVLSGAVALLVWRFRLPKQRIFAALASCYILNHFGVRSTLANGQLNLWTLAALGVAWFALRRRAKARWVALPLALAMSLKVYNVMFIPYLICKRRYQEALGAAGCLALASLASAWVARPSLWSDWFYKVLPDGAYYAEPRGLFPTANIANQSVNGILARLFQHLNSVEPVGAIALLWRVAPYALAALIFTISFSAIARASRREASSGKSYDFLDFWLVPLVIFLVAPALLDSPLGICCTSSGGGTLGFVRSVAQVLEGLDACRCPINRYRLHGRCRLSATTNHGNAVPF